jgi:hypothetical protein
LNQRNVTQTEVVTLDRLQGKVWRIKRDGLNEDECVVADGINFVLVIDIRVADGSGGIMRDVVCGEDAGACEVGAHWLNCGCDLVAASASGIEVQLISIRCGADIEIV